MSIGPIPVLSVHEIETKNDQLAKAFSKLGPIEMLFLLLLYLHCYYFLDLSLVEFLIP